MQKKINTYLELRNFLKKTPKYPRCLKKERAPLIHEGFPGTFNLSFTEFDVLKEFGNFSSFNHDFIFSTIQSCIRPQDILENIKQEKSLWKYLGTFEMSDIAGQIILKEKGKSERLHLFQLKKLISTLTSLGLKKEKIFPSYCQGGKIFDLTKGKYSFNFKVPEDTLTKEAFIREGIPEENLIPDKTRDTFLSLHVNRKTPWGFRNEINYNLGTRKNPRLIDIATLEYLLWEPIYSGEEISKNITGLKETNYSISVGGIGVERLFLAIKNLKKIQKVDYIQEFYNELRKNFPKLNSSQQMKVGECLRALHRIYSDIEKYEIKKIGKNRNYKITRFIRLISKEIKKFEEEKFKSLLIKNSKVQSWHKELKKGISPAIERMKEYYNNPTRIKELRKEKRFEKICS